jgi:hypothetical protein
VYPRVSIDNRPVSPKYRAFVQIAISITHFSSMTVSEIACVSENPVVLLPSDAPVDGLSLFALSHGNTRHLDLQPVL